MKIYWWHNKQKISTKIFIPHSPFSILRSPFPIPHSSFPISYSSFLILHFQFPIPRSSFLILHPSFSIPHSPFLILHSSFSIPHSPFLVLHSSFSIPRSPFFILHSHSQYEKSSLQLLIQPNYYTRERRDLNDTSSRRTWWELCGKNGANVSLTFRLASYNLQALIGQLRAIHRWTETRRLCDLQRERESEFEC